MSACNRGLNKDKENVARPGALSGRTATFFFMPPGELRHGYCKTRKETDA